MSWPYRISLACCVLAVACGGEEKNNDANPNNVTSNNTPSNNTPSNNTSNNTPSNNTTPNNNTTNNTPSNNTPSNNTSNNNTTNNNTTPNNDVDYCAMDALVPTDTDAAFADFAGASDLYVMMCTGQADGPWMVDTPYQVRVSDNPRSIAIESDAGELVFTWDDADADRTCAVDGTPIRSIHILDANGAYAQLTYNDLTLSQASIGDGSTYICTFQTTP